MSKILELFGFPLESTHPTAIQHRRKAQCPFMDAPCDGGGNRYLSMLNLKNHKELAVLFPDFESVQAGVCSLKVRDTPWIICPRRLLALNNPSKESSQRNIMDSLFSYGGLDPDGNYLVWSEVKVKTSVLSNANDSKSFDYTFDYVISGVSPKPIKEISELMGKSEATCERMAVANGLTLARRKKSSWVDDFPADPVLIVEVMTSSTSGGNKARRTQIGMAFEDAFLRGDRHEGPGINYRQVWARMVSQLIAKSQVGMAWGGQTVWVIQDALAEYISESTGLDLQKHANSESSEVNILAYGYGGNERMGVADETLPLTESGFYSGPISRVGWDDGGFLDIIKVGAVPPKVHLWKSLFKKKPCASIMR